MSKKPHQIATGFDQSSQFKLIAPRKNVTSCSCDCSNTDTYGQSEMASATACETSKALSQTQGFVKA